MSVVKLPQKAAPSKEWDFTFFAPNGLRAILTLDEFMVEHAAIDPVDYMIEHLRPALKELFDRRNETSPAA